MSEMKYTHLNEDTTSPSPGGQKSTSAGLERKNTFRASIRRMARYRPWESADHKEQVDGPATTTTNAHPRRAETADKPPRLPVVSLYSSREELLPKTVGDPMQSRIRRLSKVRGPQPTNCTDENLSPASRQRVERLMRKLGPEVHDAAKKKQVSGKRRLLETIPAEHPVVCSPKRRCSDSHLQHDQPHQHMSE